jgi:hypothetical protein
MCLTLLMSSLVPTSSVCSGGGEQLAGGGWSAVAGGGGEHRQYTGRENLEQFPTTENWAWASVINPYSLYDSNGVSATADFHVFFISAEKNPKKFVYHSGCI